MSARCPAIKKDGDSCTFLGKPEHKGYCGYHKSLAASAAAVVAPKPGPTRRREELEEECGGRTCPAIKKDGKQCTFPAKPECNGFCGMHARAPESRVAESRASRSPEAPSITQKEGGRKMNDSGTCRGLKVDGQFCSLLGKYDGYCHHHRLDSRHELDDSGIASPRRAARKSSGNRSRPAGYLEEYSEVLNKGGHLRDPNLITNMKRDGRYQKICAENRNRDSYTNEPADDLEVEHAWECQLSVESLCRSPKWYGIIKALTETNAGDLMFIKSRLKCLKVLQNGEENCNYLVTHSTNMKKMWATKSFIEDLASCARAPELSFEDQLGNKFEDTNPAAIEPIMRAIRRGSTAIVDGLSDVAPILRSEGVLSSDIPKVVKMYEELQEEMVDLQGDMDL